MEKIQAISFDLEGTVVDVEYAHHQGHICAAADVGITLTMEDCFRELEHFIGGPDDKVAEDIAQVAAREARVIDPKYILERDKYHYNRLLESMPVEPREGFLPIFVELQREGYPMTMGSLTDERQARLLLMRSGLGDAFSYKNIVLREQVKHLKPAPDVWIETAKRARVAPEYQLVFEDSPRGIVGAVAVGATCVGMPVYNRLDTITALVSAGAKRVFMDWREMDVLALIENLNQERG